MKTIDITPDPAEIGTHHRRERALDIITGTTAVDVNDFELNAEHDPTPRYLVEELGVGPESSIAFYQCDSIAECIKHIEWSDTEGVTERRIYDLDGDADTHHDVITETRVTGIDGLELPKQEAVSVALTLDAQQLATILAALRFYQAEGLGEPFARPDAIHDIATDLDTETSLDSKGIDELCVFINTLGNHDDDTLKQVDAAPDEPTETPKEDEEDADAEDEDAD